MTVEKRKPATAKTPPASTRREALLRAAAEVFLENGYDATSIDAIIDRAGGSKRNIYNAFGSKEGLFSAIVRENADVALLGWTVTGFEGRDLEETLSDFGERLMALYMSPSMIGIYRIAITEANRFPDLVRSFYDQGPGRAASQLAGMLALAKGRGDVDVQDCLLAARHFIGMIRDNLHLQVVLGLRLPPDQEEMRGAVASVVAIFLNGVRHGR